MPRRFVLKRPAKVEPRRYAINYTEKLNEQQHAAATATEGPFLVLAGAGTGKTRTLIFRVAYLVESGVPPGSIVLLTFTRRAAEEMLGRANVLLSGGCRDVRGGTFHAFCLKILREYAETVGFERNFTILDATDSADAIDTLRPQKKMRFPKKGALQKMISAATNTQQSLQNIVETSYPQFIYCLEDIQQLQRDYQDYKRRHNLMDYDDMLSYTAQLFDQHATIGKHIAAQCQHVLVDEYQDTNWLQDRLAQHFSSMHGNIMAVGDDAQSIYRFRGAEYANIFAFRERFPGASVLKLEHNYRSTQPILDLANRIIEQSHTRIDKKLFTQDELLGEIPALVLLKNSQDESSFVAQQILELSEKDIPLHRIAVLFRNSRSSFELELELDKMGIPFIKRGGTKLSEAAHIRDVLAYLRILENPKDAVSWHRILLLIPNIGHISAQNLIPQIISANAFGFNCNSVKPRHRESLKRLFTTLQQNAVTDRPLAEQAEAITHYYEPLCKTRYIEDFDTRWPDVEHFTSLMQTYSDRREFLSSLALNPIESVPRSGGPTENDESPLVLSTIHSAKGLEFHSVFIIRALDGVLPSSYTFHKTDELDEELRLLYVAITRAMRDVIISYPLMDRNAHTIPSRFLRDIPTALLTPHPVGMDDA